MNCMISLPVENHSNHSNHAVGTVSNKRCSLSRGKKALKCVDLWTLPAGARGGGRDFRRSRPTPSGLPTHPRRPGYAPGPKRRSRSSRLAEKACKSALEELHNAFSGRQPPAAPILNAPALAGAALQYPRRFQNRGAFLLVPLQSA